MDKDVLDLFFETGLDHIGNFKEIVNIMKRYNITKINVLSWCDDSKAHMIRGTEEELKPFIENGK